MAILNFAREEFGIGLSKKQLIGVRMKLSRSKRCVERIVEERLSLPLFSGTPGEAEKEALQRALHGLSCEMKLSGKPLSVILPDPVVSLHVFELHEIPSSGKNLHDLIRWRFSKELFMEIETIQCVFQKLGVSQGKHLVLGIAMEKSWFELIREVFCREKLMIAQLGMESCFRFNRLSEEIYDKKSGGALATIQPDHWSVSVWDRQQRLRFVRSRWIEPEGELREQMIVQDIIPEMEHVIHTHGFDNDEKLVDRVYITGDSPARIAELLGGKLEEECFPISEREGITMGSTITGSQLDFATTTLSAMLGI